jgi:hypothetical protein
VGGPRPDPPYRFTETPKHWLWGWFGKVKEESKTQDFKTQEKRERWKKCRVISEL